MGSHKSIENLYTDIVLSLKARIIVELGTGLGASLRAFLKGIKETGGILYSVDMYPKADDVKPTIDEFGNNEQVIFISGNSVDVGRQWNKGSIDILLCDSAHSKEHVYMELEAWMKFRPKIVFIHDTRTPKLELGPPYYGSKEYAEKTNKLWVELVSDFPGLAVITESPEMMKLVKKLWGS